MQEGEAVVPLLPECELEAHDLYQAKLDYIKVRRSLMHYQCGTATTLVVRRSLTLSSNEV